MDGWMDDYSCCWAAPHQALWYLVAILIDFSPAFKSKLKINFVM
jgi:hypothetical protein